MTSRGRALLERSERITVEIPRVYCSACGRDRMAELLDDQVLRRGAPGPEEIPPLCNRCRAKQEMSNG